MLDLLRSFVSVVDAGGFTRAGERVHRTQSTVSQQIRRLEETLGRPLLLRDSKPVVPTEEGERLLAYARRILALAEEARDVVARPASEGAIRLGLAEDFAAYRLSEMLSQFARARPGLRLDVRCGLSVRLRHDVEHGELDLALLNSKTRTLDILLGLGSATFGTPFSFKIGAVSTPQPVSIAVGDLDGDGRLDVVVAAPGIAPVSVLVRA